MRRGTSTQRERTKTTHARCSMRTEGYGGNDGQRLERSLRTNVTHRVARMESLRVSPVWWSQTSAFGADRANIETTSKHTSAADKHSRCVADCGRFPVIAIAADTRCPRCDLIFNDTAVLPRRVASVDYPPPAVHSLVINAEASAGPSGDTLWQKVRDRWRARRSESEAQEQQAAGSDEGTT